MSFIPGIGGIFRVVFKRIPRLCNKRKSKRHSFQAGTLVWVERDLIQLQIPIEEIVIGDKVKGYNSETKEIEWQEIVHLIRSTKKQYLVDIELETGNVIQTTGEHPFNVGKGWVIADDLKVGDAIFSDSGEEIVVAGLTKYSEIVPVYNLTIEEVHNYFVGVDGVLGHNIYLSQSEIELIKYVIKEDLIMYRPYWIYFKIKLGDNSVKRSVSQLGGLPSDGATKRYYVYYKDPCGKTHQVSIDYHPIEGPANPHMSSGKELRRPK